MSNRKKNVKESSGAGAVMGFQVPIGIKKRKKKVDEMLELNDSVSISEVLSFVKSLDESKSAEIEKMLDNMEYVKLAERIKNEYQENALRSLIRKRIREIVRKQDNGQFALYAPNPGKKKVSYKVGEFPTKLAARRAELQRFPPKDPSKLARMRKEMDKLRKNPDLVAKKEPEERPANKPVKKKTRKESIDRIVSLISESLFNEQEAQGSKWDDYISRLSKQAVLADKSFQSHQNAIEKKSEGALRGSMKVIKNTLGPTWEVEVGDIRKKEDNKLYYGFSVGDKEGTAKVGPIFVYVEDGKMKMEFSDNAKASLTKIDPDRVKALRGELVSFKEDVLEKDDSIVKAVEKRDDYLMKIEKKVDGMVADMTSLEITMLKNVLANKYRKIS